MSQITTHILDTSKGTPAAGVEIILFKEAGDGWNEIGRDTTNSDGRAISLVVQDVILSAGIYKLRFNTQEYFDRQNVATFYPYIVIIFQIESTEHYHVPLLLNPFGYTTYRGS